MGAIITSMLLSFLYGCDGRHHGASSSQMISGLDIQHTHIWHLVNRRRGMMAVGSQICPEGEVLLPDSGEGTDTESKGRKMVLNWDTGK